MAAGPACSEQLRLSGLGGRQPGAKRLTWVSPQGASQHTRDGKLQASHEFDEEVCGDPQAFRAVTRLFLCWVEAQPSRSGSRQLPGPHIWSSGGWQLVSGAVEMAQSCASWSRVSAGWSLLRDMDVVSSTASVVTSGRGCETCRTWTAVASSCALCLLL